MQWLPLSGKIVHKANVLRRLNGLRQLFICQSAANDCGEAGDDFHSKSLFLVKNKGQWNTKSGPEAAYGNFAMRIFFSGSLDSK